MSIVLKQKTLDKIIFVYIAHNVLTVFVMHYHNQDKRQ